jgi:TatD DNase family protein
MLCLLAEIEKNWNDPFMQLFDAHCHLTANELFPDLGSIVQRAADAGVVGMAVCGTCPNDWVYCIDAQNKFQGSAKSPAIFAMLGIHPWFVSKGWKKEFQTLEAYCDGTHRFFQTLETDAPTQSVGIGETGLDFQEKFKNRAEQEECFRAHLELAERLNRPVAIHCVRAWGRMLDILREYPGPKKILHAFSGAVELIPELTALNGYFSFCGNVTNPNAKRVRAAAVAVPVERLLIETDAPDFSPAGCEAPNEPANLIYVARAVAELRNVPVEEVAELTFRNAASVFG